MYRIFKIVVIITILFINFIFNKLLGFFFLDAAENVDSISVPNTLTIEVGWNITLIYDNLYLIP